MDKSDPEIRAKRAERRATQANRRADEAERALALMRVRAEGAEVARDDARRLLEPVRAELAALLDPEMTDLRLSDGGVNMKIAGPMVERLALALAGYVRGPGEPGDGTKIGGNYVEMHIHARAAPFERYAVTVQRSDRPTPHELRVEAERKLGAVEAEIIRAHAALDAHGLPYAIGEKTLSLAARIALIPRRSRTAPVDQLSPEPAGD